MLDNIGVKIKNLRKSRGLTQEELGGKIGVTKATINKYETGIVVNLRRPVIERLAKALGTSPAYLMGWTDNSSINVESNNGVIGQNSGEIHIEAAKELSKEEQELLRIFASLDVKGRMELLTTAFRLEESCKV